MVPRTAVAKYMHTERSALESLEIETHRTHRQLVSPARRLAFILVASTLVAAAISQFASRTLGIRTQAVGYKLLAQGNKPRALAEGSSLMIDGLAWKEISAEVGHGIENWFVAGSSPSEWDTLQSRSSGAPVTFVVVSAYDLNENFLCDFRAEVVPLSQTVGDLWRSKADWAFIKRVLAQYPIRYLRILFPTAGRSDGVMVGVRESLSKLLKPWITIQSESGPAIAVGEATTEEIKTDKLTEWEQARVLRRLALMRTACQGKHTFNGPKRLAFERMLRRGAGQGQVVVVVLPVSPLYKDEFLSPETFANFEGSLRQLEQAIPTAKWIHLERLTALNSNEYFWDLVHMNRWGQRIATDELLRELRAH